MTLERILAEIDKLKDELNSSLPFTTERKDLLDRKLKLEFHFNSNHIEGNTLTYSETELLFMFDEIRGNHTWREYEEMKASDVALKMVKELAEDKNETISETFIKNLNKIILVRPYWKEAITPDGQKSNRKILVGNYKENPNSVRLSNGEIFYYTSPQETPIAMGELLQWYKSCIDKHEFHPVVLGALLHYKFVCIHPFDDGNGRISRLLLNYVLFYYNYPPVIIKSEDKNNYLRALHDADTGNLDSFIIYIGQQLIWSLKLSIKAARGESLEDQNDWIKKLSVLKKDLNTKEEIRLKKSNEVISTTLNEITLPNISVIKEKLSEYDDLFLSSRVLLRGSNQNYQNFADYLKVNEEKVRQYYSEEIDFLFEFKEFTKDIDNIFDLSCSLKLRFDTYRYDVMVGDEIIFWKLYHQELNENDIQEISNAIGRSLMKELEKNLK